MGRGLRKKLVLSLGFIASIFTILSLIVVAGCSNSLMDDVLEKIEEDKIEDGTAETYTVTYFGNENTGGDVPVDVTQYIEGETVTVLGNVNNLEKTGYSFVNWNTDPNGLGDTYIQGPSLTMGDSDVKLYAYWTDLPTYTVDFNSYGGSDVADQNIIEGGTVTEPADPTRTGFNFSGWYGESSYDTLWNFGSDIVMQDITLHAKWIEFYTVTYFANGATDGTAPLDENHYLSGDYFTVLNNTGNLVKTDYTFEGWNTNSAGNGSDHPEGGTSQIGNLDIELYAKWILIQYSYALGLATDGTGSGSIDTTNSTANGSYDIGTLVTAQATADLECVFVGWYDAASGGTEVSTDNPYTFALNSDVTLYAKWFGFSSIAYRDMISVTGGTFTQEDTNSNSFSHTISTFNMAKFEVTYELWYTVRAWALSHGYIFANSGREGNDGTAGAAPTGAKYEPVTFINWRDAIVWCNAYSEMSGYTPCYTYSSAVIKDSRDTNSTVCDVAECNWNSNGYRLPTEGEWQYAASNKGATPYNYASGAIADYNNAAETQKVAWYSYNSGIRAHNVGTTDNPSALTLWDMSGNVSEFLWDWLGSYPGTSIDYTGAVSGDGRVSGRGNWASASISLQIGIRGGFAPWLELSYIGFRVASGQ